MITIIFEAHSTTFDNENHISSGWNDVRLSQTGIDQAKELGARYAGNQPDAIFFSDLKRAEQTVNIAFDPNMAKLFTDWRLRECNYGDMNASPSSEVDAKKAQCISQPFPGGESYEQCVRRMASFLDDLKRNWEGRTVMIVGHRATQYSLEYLINGKPLADAIAEPWSWQPGWKYQIQ